MVVEFLEGSRLVSRATTLVLCAYHTITAQEASLLPIFRTLSLLSPNCQSRMLLGVLVFQVAAWKLEAGVQCQSSLLVPVEEVKVAERAPKVLSLVERCSVEFAASKTTAVAYSLASFGFII